MEPHATTAPALAPSARRAAPGPTAAEKPASEALALSFAALRTWAREHRRAAKVAAVFLAGNVVYASWRAACLASCDLRVGYLVPTRGLLLHGADPLRDYSFNAFPPFFYCVLAPLALLPDAIASLLWSAVQLACFFVALALSLQLAGRAWHLARPRALLPALMAAPLLLNNLHLGQSNLLPLALLALGAFLTFSRREWTAGLAVSFAVAFKVTPALFLGYLAALKLRWRVAIAATVGLALFGVLVPGAVFGPARCSRWLSEWSGAILVPFASGGSVQTTSLGWHHTNQSLEAFAQRQLTPYGKQQYGAVHVLDPAILDEAGAHRVATVARALIALALIALALKHRGICARTFPFELALIPLAALFISPVAWTSHYIAAAPAYVVAFNAQAQLPRGAWRRILRISLGAAVGLLALATTPMTESLSPVFLGHFGLWCVLLACALFGPRLDEACDR